METLTDLSAIEAELDRALAISPADETEIVWTESWTATTSSQPAAPAAPHLHRTVAVRVLERGRFGSYRTVAGSSGELDDAVRQAMAQARIRPSPPGVFHLPRRRETTRPITGLHDPAIAGLDLAGATDLLRDLVRPGESARLTWGDGRYVVRNSRGVEAATEVTTVEVAVVCGAGAGAGRAEHAARQLAELGAAAVAEEARTMHAAGAPAPPPTEPVPLLLSTAAAGALLGALNEMVFTASAYRESGSLLRERRGVPTFDARLSVRDDGTSPSGLPFPFDLEGTPKRPVDLIVQGVPLTPALDERQAAAAGLAATGHSISGDDARAENLFLLPGDASLEDLLTAVGDGLWIGAIGDLVCVDPFGLRFRALARGVRRIAAGRLGEVVVDLVWEDSLRRVFASLIAVGRRLGTSHASLVGCVSAPRLALSGGGVLHPSAA